jgi:hypothetical protein
VEPENSSNSSQSEESLSVSHRSNSSLLLVSLFKFRAEERALESLIMENKFTTRGVSRRGSTCTFSSIEEYVEELGGKRVIKKVLIANNGISAIKAIRSIRKWSYAMFSDEHRVSRMALITPP